MDVMKLVALMVARNEDWIIGLSLRAALEWADAAVVLDHGSTDRTADIVEEVTAEWEGRKSVAYMFQPAEPFWPEMEHRQATLELGRVIGGTHFAIVDADEVVTSNLWPFVRGLASRLQPAQALDLPMIACWRSIRRYREDSSVWSKSVVTLAFRDRPGLEWRPARDGYEHHSRPPAGTLRDRFRPFPARAESAAGRSPDRGGVMHLQWVDWRRVRAKHAWYRMVEALRWPGRRTPGEINLAYSLALDEDGLALRECRPEWLDGLVPLLPNLRLGGVPWQEDEILRMIDQYGIERFAGLDIPADLAGEEGTHG